MNQFLTSTRSSGDLVIQALLESKSTTFTNETAIEIVLGFTGTMKDIGLNRYEVDVMNLLLKREDFSITPEIRTIVMKRADRKTVEMFENKVSTSTEAAGMDMEEQLVAAASNMDHAPEIVNYLLEKAKSITLTARLLDIAIQREEENEPNIRGNLIMTALLKSNVIIHLENFENFLDTVVRDFDFATAKALLRMPELALKVTEFTLEAAVQNPQATPELLTMLLEYQGESVSKRNIEKDYSLETTSKVTAPSLTALSEVDTVEFTTPSISEGSEPMLQKSPELREAGDRNSSSNGEIVVDEGPCHEVVPLEVQTASENSTLGNFALASLDSTKPQQHVDSRVNEYVMISAVSNVEVGEDLVGVLLRYCDTSIITEGVLRSAVRNRKKAWKIVELLIGHAEPDTSSVKSPDTSSLIEKFEVFEKASIEANKRFWRLRITRRIFESAMRNWTDTGNLVLLQLLKNDLEAVLTRDMFLEIIRQHKLNVVKDLFANHGSTFPVTEDIAEDVFAAAAANWIAGVRVFRFITEENKDLAAKIVPQSEKIAEALCRNWKSGKSVLDLLLRRFKLCVTERVLLACARNPYAGAEIMKTLLRSYPGQVSIDVLRASAENFACGVPLLKLLLQRGEYTRVPAEVFQAACANGSCGHEILDFLADGNYSFTISEAALLSCSRNGSSTRVFMVSPVTEGREVPISQDLLQRQREKIKNGNQLLKPPLQYGGIVCLINMYASRWQECNIAWGLQNGVSEDETWVRRGADWVWGTGRGILLDLLENHWIEGDSVPNSVLDAAVRNFDSEIIHALLKKQDKVVSQSLLLSATTNELYAHEVLVALLSEKRLLPLDSITPAVLASAARNKACGRQLLEELWTEESELTDDLWDAALDNPSQEKQIIAFLLEKGYKATEGLVDDAFVRASEVSTIKLLLDNFDDKTSVITDDTIRNAAGNAIMGSDLVDEILKIHPTIQIPDDALEAAAGNQRCGAKVMELLLTRKPLSEVKEINEVLVPAAENPEQALRLLSMLLDADSTIQIAPQVMKAAVENGSIAPQVVAFLVNRATDVAIDVEVLLAAVANPDRAVQLLTVLHMKRGKFRNIDTLFNAAIMNWKSGLQILHWMIDKDPFFHPDIMTSMELAVQNVGCGVEILDYLLLEHQAPQVLPMSIWTGAAANLGCGNVLNDHLLRHCDYQVDITEQSLLKAAAKNLNWSTQIFKAFSNISILSDSPAKIGEEVLVCLVGNWKSGEDTIRFLKSSPRWSLAITDVLLQMIVQNTPDTDGALAVLLDGVEEFDFPELPDAVSPFWLVRSLKAIEVLVAKCKRSSIPQELVRKIVGGWRAEAVAKIIEGIEITQEAFLASATNILNNGDITKLLGKWNPDLVVTEEMLQKAVGNNFDLTKTILDMGQAVSKKSLEVAVKQDQTRILSLFLEIMGKAKIGDSVLAAALDNGSPRMIQLLLKHGLENPISEGQMCKAASNDANLEIMRMLLVHRHGESASEVDIPQSIMDEAIKQSSVLILKLLLEHNVAKSFTENTWAKAVGQKNMEIVQMLIQHDPDFEVTDHILKSAVKSSRVEALKLLLAHESKIKITQRMMERAAKCKTVEILKLLAGHLENAESFTITERFLKRAAGNKSEVVTFVLEQWPNIKITEGVFECVVENHDSKVLDLFYGKFSQIPFTTRHLVAAADHRSPERFRAVYQRAKEHSILPSEEY
ncbi:hypothetical protein NA56DRAFT_205539 [Hyaloscypha hepaticicola]|uniref:Ankyrin n=1 Tax=Hyaloscypha hepaticicola TaxID=2082293 RepID=A0A2J6PYR9_9HELO|nr:hypothetical protein NA56DRAFT_205539 [Hyaloscypha hepaticicola]